MAIVMELRKQSYARHQWTLGGNMMRQDDIDGKEWADSLVAFKDNVPIGTIRLLRADIGSLNRLLSYRTWTRELEQLADKPSDRIIEFNRFAVVPTVAPTTVAPALLKAAMAIQLIENVSAIVGEIRSDHLAYYRRFLGMTSSEDSRSDGVLPGKYYLVTGRPQQDIKSLKSRTPWIVPCQADLASWQATKSITW